MDKYQRWRLCPRCGEAIDLRRAAVYLEVHDHREAESIIEQVEEYLAASQKKDLSEDELTALRARYARWVKEAVRHQG
ncbi:MAG: DUF1922 domain-containing protein [Methanoculleaceae archaeon]